VDQAPRLLVSAKPRRRTREHVGSFPASLHDVSRQQPKRLRIYGGEMPFRLPRRGGRGTVGSSFPDPANASRTAALGAGMGFLARRQGGDGDASTVVASWKGGEEG
jgi:hypothetical protein